MTRDLPDARTVVPGRAVTYHNELPYRPPLPLAAEVAGVPAATVARVAGALLQRAADEFASHAHHHFDFDLARWCSDVAERRTLLRAYHAWNGDPELDPQRAHRPVDDASLMRFLGELLAGGAAPRR